MITTALPAGLKRSSRKIIKLCTSTSKNGPIWPYGDVVEPEWYGVLLRQKKLSGKVTKRIITDVNQKKIIKRLTDDQIVTIGSEINKDLTREKVELCYNSTLNLTFPEHLTEVSKSSLEEYATLIETKTNRRLKLSEVKTLYYHAKLAKKNSSSVPRREILRLYKGASKPLKELSRAGIINTTSERIYRNPFGDIINNFSVPEHLTDEQSEVISKIEKFLGENCYKTFLLHGVTGSGKTEVYLKTAATCLKAGKGVLVLVPEIALATQLESHFVSRFGSQVVLLHSGLSSGEKYDQWSLAACGDANIVIGARSAVYAPLKNLGLIIVDEEHDSGFKQDDSLKYNARDLAVLRANFQNAIVILGSATPSMTSYYHAKTGKYQLLSMKNRVGGAVLPKVEIIDLKKDNKQGKRSVFHEKFIQNLESNLRNNEQSIILLNRRGFSTSYLCQDCGESVQCLHCNVALTFHKHSEELICHYCGYNVSSKLICSKCHSEKLVPFGFGTERIEEELKKKFPHSNIARLDSDTASDKKRFIHILREMHNQEIDILIGTQMIAKGHHFPHVTFVGVVWADGGLNMPDFRAAERTFQLLSQVTGRAGRGEKKGRVLIQTMRPNHYAVEFSKTHQYEQFYEREIKIRERPVFPPFVRLVCLRIKGNLEFNVRKTAQDVVSICMFFSKSRKDNVEILGPASSPLQKLQDLYRWQILLKSADIGCLHALCDYVLENKRQLITGKTEITVDIDPENMM